MDGKPMGRDPNAVYMDRLMLAVEKGVVSDGAIVFASIYHEDGCRQRQGSVLCDCDPDIRLDFDQGYNAEKMKFWLMPDGTLKRAT